MADGYSAGVKNTLSVLISSDGDVYRHLATEEWLLEMVPNNHAFLFFWVAHNAVVIGKNQNPWREVAVPTVLRESCHLARRISGGGAVFHDAGNLNTSFLLPRSHYNRRLIFRVFELAFAELGVSSHFLGSTNLGVDGRKISGHAFAFRGQVVLHHATVLIACDTDKMRRLLRGPNSGIQTRAVPSNPAEVANLTDFVSDLRSSDLVAAITRAAQEVLRVDIRKEEAQAVVPLSEIEHRAAELASWEWVYGHTPPFEIHMQSSTPIGHLQADLWIERGTVVRGTLSVTGTALPQVSLDETRFMPNELTARLMQAGWDDHAARDICDRLLTA